MESVEADLSNRTHLDQYAYAEDHAVPPRHIAHDYLLNRRCLGGCGCLLASGSYCAECNPRKSGAWSKGRDRTAQARFRRGLMARAGGRCEWVEAVRDNDTHSTMVRCSAITDLRACHITPLSKGGSYEMGNGVLLCRTHDRLTDRYAR